jgi:two-component system nitrogen regulation response regulator GlnG
MDIPNPGISEKGKKLLRENEWPGNVRELSNTIQKSLIFSRGGPLDDEGITLAAGENSGSVKNAAATEDINAILKKWVRKKISVPSQDRIFDALMGHFESIITGEALKITRGNRTQAAKLLGLSRPTLLAKIDKHDLKIETAVDISEDF